MTLPPFVSDESEIPEGLGEHYAKGEDGRLYLTVKETDGWGMTNIGQLKAAARDRLKERDEARRELFLVRDLWGDLDPNEVKTQIAEVESLRERLKGAKSDTKVEELLSAKEKQWKAKYDADITELSKQLDTYKGLREESDRREAYDRAFSQVEANRALTVPILRDFVKMEQQEDGTFRPVVVNDRGEPRQSQKPGSTENMDLVELLTVLRADKTYAPLFPGTRASGPPDSQTTSSGPTMRGPAQLVPMDGGFDLEKIASGEQVRGE